MTIETRKRQAIVRKATKRVEEETSLIWEAFPGLARQISKIVLEVVEDAA